ELRIEQLADEREKQGKGRYGRGDGEQLQRLEADGSEEDLLRADDIHRVQEKRKEHMIVRYIVAGTDDGDGLIGEVEGISLVPADHGAPLGESHGPERREENPEGEPHSWGQPPLHAVSFSRESVLEVTNLLGGRGGI